MRKLVVMAGLVVAAFACSSAGDMVHDMLDSGVPDAGAQTSAPVAKLVGYTNGAYVLNANDINEDGGLFNTYARCQSDFGASARICTVTEVLGTVDLPAPPPGGGGTQLEGAWAGWLKDSMPCPTAGVTGPA